MGIRPKLFLVFIAFGIIPMLVLSIVNYWSGMRAVEALLLSNVERDALAVANGVETRERECEVGLVNLARTRPLRDYVRSSSSGNGGGAGSQKPQASGEKESDSSPPVSSSADNDVPKDVRVEAGALLLSNQKYYAAITCLDPAGHPLFHVEQNSRLTDDAVVGLDSLRWQTKDFLPSTVAADERVWTTTEQTPIRSPSMRESSGITVRYTVPVFTGEEGATITTRTTRGALVVDLKLGARIKEAASSLNTLSRSQASSATARTTEPASSSRLVIVLDRTGRIVYHTNDALLYQSALSAAPSFKQVAEAMMARESGWKFYDSPDGTRWLAVYRPIASLELSVAAAGDYTASVRGLHRAGLIVIILSVLVGLATAILLIRVVRHTALSIERVTEGAVRIAGGNLDQRIEVRSSDEVHLLAESFNRMSDRLREQIAREAEARQFQSFMRLSAMLTHDLKNAISSLSMLVRNMERQFDNEEFRADAMRSLKDATDKLRSLVARLSEPVRSLSGEFKMPRPTDLVPIIKRVLAATVGAGDPFHEVEMRLPSSLLATVDAERLEKVIENLVLNALEAMGTEKGKLTVEAGAEGDDQIFFSITDTGSGMSEEFQRTRLFHAFSTTKAKGIGLGLYTCREVIKVHGGHIEVKSEKGTGTTFRVVLPSSQITKLMTSSR